MGLVLSVGKLFINDISVISGSEVNVLWYSLHAEYTNRIRDSTVVNGAVRLGIQTVLIEAWLEKNSEKILNKIQLSDSEGNFFYFTRQEIDGWYYRYVYCATLDLLIPKIQERQGQFRYFVNTLKKQGWIMSRLFESKLLNEGIFLLSYRDQNQRIPYQFMKKLNIKMG
ncbi:hypothetical protein [Enterococcus rotai]|uniref:hypothetical protein n=1 Tax=Enterococcus rotai TaxID=118060 RepID=UPI0032B50CA5